MRGEGVGGKSQMWPEMESIGGGPRLHEDQPRDSAAKDVPDDQVPPGTPPS